MVIQGITVQLGVKTQIGVDSFRNPVYAYDFIDVDNILIGEPTTEDITNSLNLHGKKIAYTLAIPKDDQNDWTDTKIKFWGREFMTFGIPTQGIEENIPLSWNKKVKVEAYG